MIATGVARNDSALEGLTATVRPLVDVANAEGRRLLLPLFGAVGLVFFIACANVAGLLLARGLQRQSEYALRAALGATWRRLVRQALTESVALALVSAIVGGALRRGPGRSCSRRSAGTRCLGRTPCPSAGRCLRSRSSRHCWRLWCRDSCPPRARPRQPVSRARGDTQHGQPRRAATRERRGRSADRVDGRIALRRGAPRSNGAEPGARPPRLRHREYSGAHCDGGAGRSVEGFSHAGARTRGRDSRCAPRCVRVGTAPHRQQLARRHGGHRREQPRIGSRSV